MATYTRWYRVGEVTTTKGSVEVTGNETEWSRAGIQPGDMFTTDNGQSFYEVEGVVDDTHLKLKTPFIDSNLLHASYGIVRQYNATMASQIAAWASKLLLDFDTSLNGGLLKLTGKSAYEIAVEEGFEGTKSEWLEGLKAAGEWSATQARVTALSVQANEATTTSSLALNLATTAKNNEGNLNDLATTAKSTLTAAINEVQQNAFKVPAIDETVQKIAVYTKPMDEVPIVLQRMHQVRGKNLGTTMTTAQYNEIVNGTFNDIYVGDYWENMFSYKGSEDEDITQVLRWRIVDIQCTSSTAPSSWVYNPNVFIFLDNTILFPIVFWDEDSKGKSYQGSVLYQKGYDPALKVVRDFFPNMNLPNRYTGDKSKWADYNLPDASIPADDADFYSKSSSIKHSVMPPRLEQVLGIRPYPDVLYDSKIAATSVRWLTGSHNIGDQRWIWYRHRQFTGLSPTIQTGSIAANPLFWVLNPTRGGKYALAIYGNNLYYSVNGDYTHWNNIPKSFGFSPVFYLNSKWA